MTAAIERYLPGITEIKQAIPHCFGQAGLLQYHEVYDSYLNEGIPKALAHELASIRGLFSALDIIEIAEEHHLNVTRVADAYFFIGEYLELTWLRSQVIIHTTESYWEALSREILRDDLDLQQRQLTSGVIRHGLQSSQSIQACFEDWTQEHTCLMARWRTMLTNLKSSATLSYTMYFVTIRELLDFTQMVIQVLQEHDR